MKGDRYQPKQGVHRVRIGSLVIDEAGHKAESDEQSAQLERHPSLKKSEPKAADKT